MSESTMRQWVTQTALREWGALAIENLLSKGTPDVFCTRGAVELKEAAVPKRAETVVRVRHFSPEQRSTLVGMHARGWRLAVVLRLGRSWIMLPALWAAEYLGRVPAWVLVQASPGRVWSRRPSGESFREEFLREVYRGAS